MTLLEARELCGAATGRNGGQLRPHLYSRYPKWSERFGPDVAMDLIRHELAHLSAFKQLAEEEGITEEVCLKFGETFDAAMTEEALVRLKGALEAMRKDQGDDNDIVKLCKLIENPRQAEEFSQMKGAIGVIAHPAGQMSVPLSRIASNTPDRFLDGHTNLCMRFYASFSRKAT